MNVNPGLRTENILTMNLSLPDVRYPTPQQRLTFYKTLVERLEAVPGVRSAGAVQFLPLRVSILSFRIGVTRFQIQGHAPVPEDQQPIADFRSATAGYFNTMGVALRQGRLFDQRDNLDSKRVVIVNEAMVRRHFANEDPLGQQILFGSARRRSWGWWRTRNCTGWTHPWSLPFTRSIRRSPTQTWGWWCGRREIRRR